MMHDTERTKYLYALLTEVLHRILDMEQYEKKILIYYTSRFNKSSGVFKSHVGPEVLDKLIEKLKNKEMKYMRFKNNPLKRNSLWDASIPATEKQL